jgi:hypothetical protein
MPAGLGSMKVDENYAHRDENKPDKLIAVI